MKRTGCKMSSTDGLFGNGVYDENIKYKKYNAEYYYQTLFNIYKNIQPILDGKHCKKFHF